MRSKTITIIIILYFTVFLTFGCDKGTEPRPVSVPVLTTTEVSGITASLALTGDNITSDGGAEVTVRGVCWSADLTPTITVLSDSDKNLDYI